MGNVQTIFRDKEAAFHTEGYEKLDFSLLYVNGAFALENVEIAERHRQFRCGTTIGAVRKESVLVAVNALTNPAIGFVCGNGMETLLSDAGVPVAVGAEA